MTTVETYTLPAGASRLDAATLRVMKWWHRSARDFVRAMLVTMLLLGVVISLLLVAVPSRGTFGTLGGGLVVLGVPLGWLAHRSRHPVAIAVNRRARSAGITTGVLLAPLGIGVVAVAATGLHLVVGSLGAVAPLQLLPGLVMLAVGWVAAAVRHRRLEQVALPAPRG